MKKLSLFALAAAGMLFGACSSDDVTVVDEKKAATQYADAFIGISVQLPNAATPTRANDDLNNGLEDEFKVEDASLLLFKGANPESATYIGNWSLTDPFNKDNQGAGDGEPTPQNGVTWAGGTGVTSTSVAVAQISDLSLLPSEDLYAYVIVNRNDVTLPQNNATFESWMEQKFAAEKIGSEYKATDMTDQPISGKGLMMTNAPVSMTPGGVAASTGEIITAVKLDKSKIASTREAALNAPAGCIYVERSAAKVTAHLSTNATTELKNPAGGEMVFALDAFQIINTEPTYFNVRHADVDEWLGYATDFSITNSNAQYRFVSLPKFSPTLPATTGHLNNDKAYRTYFGQDPQYDDLATLLNTVATDNGNWIAPAPQGRAFVVENTFNVENQIRHNTTQATLRMKLNGGTSFYSITNDATLYAAAGIEAAIAAKAQTLYGISTFMEDAKDYVLAELKKADGTKGYNAEVTISAELEKAEADAAAGDQTYNLSYTITATDDAGTAVTAPDLSDELKAAWNAAVTSAKNDYKVTLYKGGMTYYNVRIQHFGEAETPWDNVTDEGVIKIQPGENVAQIYGYTDEPAAQEKANNRFLGRYGVVRDNWYDLSIESIKKLGSATPTPVNGDNTPDDIIEEQFYISCHVHILPWVLRTQHVNF